MFFLGISANILIYLLASAFLGVLLYTHEKSVPAEYVSSAVVVVETRQEEPVHYEWYAYCEQIVPKAEKEHTIVYVEIQTPLYVPPHYQSLFLTRKALRAPPVPMA
ncbi:MULTISPECIES: hypothetical protein [Culturomica]|jgi:hypothetical protein|uniref:hypothetical protein n=1 Tax=Culturomica TaxID=1926651 RepID=UPI00033830E0|nr:MULTISPECIES: hypothetical protein [Odoribacteraceae]RHV98542.1 hypothetical protein DXA95_00005 [Odoribacter sp. OF09-27XD]CCZ06313.1 putative uncharacterized protein [Odoribacter sp. CAG:788]HBO27177.1 hypothetical protein [Culturomica sp.]